jgi:uncharacterized repeat protein (TIGR03803 family)
LIRPSTWKKATAVFVLSAATAICARAQLFTTVVNFDGNDGADPLFVSLAQGTDGNLYGTTSEGGAGAGTVFKVSPTGTLTTLYNFCAQTNCTDGAYPEAGLVLATDGNFYGTTFNGGANLTGGTVFRITPGGRMTTLYSFCSQQNCADGAAPYARLVQATDGDFYGTTYGGGAAGFGTAFKITSTGALTTLYTFCANTCEDGAEPQAGLVQATDGNLYGTAGGGGSHNAGTIFKITPQGKLTTLYSFGANSSDGASPLAPLIQASDGNLYGTTVNGGSPTCPPNGYSCGTVFRITLKGTLTTLYSFGAVAEPFGGLTQATDGDLYGTTTLGGDLTCNAPLGCGSLFRISSRGVLTTLHSFEATDGERLYGELAQATVGNLYGVTSGGGTVNAGTVFSLDMFLDTFVAFVRPYGKVGQTGGILGQGFTGTTSVSLNGTPAQFTVVSDTFIKATVPPGATTGFVTVVTPRGTLTSNVPFRVLQ